MYTFIYSLSYLQGEGSDQEEAFRRQSFKLCRIVLPDNSTTVLPCKPGESLSTVVQRLLEKREFNYSAFEVVTVSNGKVKKKVNSKIVYRYKHWTLTFNHLNILVKFQPLDLNMEVSEITAREIKVEPRAFIGIELPHGWRVGVRANPARKVAEVLKPILAQHSLKVDAVVVHDVRRPKCPAYWKLFILMHFLLFLIQMQIDTNELVDIKWPMGRVDGHNLNVRTKGR